MFRAFAQLRPCPRVCGLAWPTDLQYTPRMVTAIVDGYYYCVRLLSATAGDARFTHWNSPIIAATTNAVVRQLCSQPTDGKIVDCVFRSASPCSENVDGPRYTRCRIVAAFSLADAAAAAAAANEMENAKCAADAWHSRRSKILPAKSDERRRRGAPRGTNSAGIFLM